MCLVYTGLAQSKKRVVEPSRPAGVQLCMPITSKLACQSTSCRWVSVPQSVLVLCKVHMVMQASSDPDDQDPDTAQPQSPTAWLLVFFNIRVTSLQVLIACCAQRFNSDDAHQHLSQVQVHALYTCQPVKHLVVQSHYTIKPSVLSTEPVLPLDSATVSNCEETC